MFRDGRLDAQPAGVRRQQSFSTIALPSTTTLAAVTSSGLSQVSTTLTSLHVSHTSIAYASETPGPSPADICTVALPAGGVIQFNDTAILSLVDTVSFQAPCEESIFSASDSGIQEVIPQNDPFYASIAPQIYALATATIISYLLVIIIFITPRTFFVGGPSGSSAASGGSGLLGRGMTLLGTGTTQSGMVGIGQRPLLQKIATITVAVSLTIATSDTFDEAEKQYYAGLINASQLVEKVVTSTEITITRIISDTFLWLAQVQTLIRLFPRHKEKVTIKWLGFGLVTCDTVFSLLENFYSKSDRIRPENFKDAFPALSYLFELAISLIYASCVVYYALSKRRFAFWHSKMRNICLVALMSLTAVLIPVVFFIVDIAQPNIATWGEYIRWVGSAAASVVVWEWVERIEALERDEKKDGILGREVYDGDEMLDMTSSEDLNVDRGSGGAAGVHFGSGGKDADETKRRITWKNVRHLSLNANLKRPQRKKKTEQSGKTSRRQSVAGNMVIGAGNGITRPPQVATPISRSDTNSAASTVYAIRYHNPLSPSPAIPEHAVVNNVTAEPEVPKDISDDTTLTSTTTTTNNEEEVTPPGTGHQPESDQAVSTGRQAWRSVANPFKRKRAEPPAEVAAQIIESNTRRSPADRSLGLRSRFDAFASQQRERFGNRAKTRTPLQVTVIPAQPRGSRVQESAGDLNDGNTQSANGPVPAINTTASNTGGSSGENTPRRASMLPVTVIPAPVRGGRTWSPDDMRDNAARPDQQRHDSDSSSSSGRQSQPAVHNEVGPTASPKQQILPGNRLTPPVHQWQIPGRSANSPGTVRSLLRTPDFGRDRAATTTSLSGRLEQSPITITGVGDSPSPNLNGRIPGHSSTPSRTRVRNNSGDNLDNNSGRSSRESSATVLQSTQHVSARQPALSLGPKSAGKQRQIEDENTAPAATNTNTNTSTNVNDIEPNPTQHQEERASPAPLQSGPGRPSTQPL